MTARFSSAADAAPLVLGVSSRHLRHLTEQDIRLVEQFGYLVKEPAFFHSLSCSIPGLSPSSSPSSSPSPCSPSSRSPLSCSSTSPRSSSCTCSPTSPSSCSSCSTSSPSSLLASASTPVAPLSSSLSETTAFFQALSLECEAMFGSDGAATSAHMAHYADSRVRGDSLVWLHRFPDLALHFPLLARCVQALSLLVADLEHACTRFQCVRTETQLAMYPVGARYVRHLDANPWREDGIARRLTILLYLNHGWNAEHGGQLRLFDVEGQEDHGRTTLDVVPVAGRMVLFQSARVEHEVLVSSRPRFAITTWLYEAPSDRNQKPQRRMMASTWCWVQTSALGLIGFRVSPGSNEEFD
eukprot:CAMPEP_0174234884 /NCGR_PEP_ID=MMETSP0417-20130205/4507_1 /TAXON_ID=242541 /ORGANISM="Mayorella sp, Strain BSH-02190019" /LENGTH=354 /DNA_ID=CAMNT_0015313307 /DNA_START=31 /DNA_END=1093 /DNA_ORIENTATION=-